MRGTASRFHKPRAYAARDRARTAHRARRRDTIRAVNLEAYVRASLKALHFRPSKQRGQNFLIDESAQEALVQRADIAADDTVIEVGTGLATLTRRLARAARRVYTFEIEAGLYTFLGRELAEFTNVELIKKSFNSYSLGELLETLDSGRHVKVCANLPYQITSLFLRAIVEYQEWIEIACVMMQREVAERLAAQPGSRAYGSLSVWLQTYFDVEIVAEVPPDAFIPPPKVHSVVVALTPRRPRQARGMDATQAGDAGDESDVYDIPESLSFFRLTEGLFRHRRKTVENALRKVVPGMTAETALTALTRARVAPDTRPEKLGRSELRALAIELEKLGINVRPKQITAGGFKGESDEQ